MKGSVKEELKAIGITFFTAFILNAFVVTCSFAIFFHYIDLSGEKLSLSAVFTFLNVLILSFLFVIIHTIWRHITVNRPIKKIRKSLEKITSGDFTEMINVDEIGGNYSAVAESINRMTRELSETETLKTDFISNVSHEIKTPLSVMQNYGQLLQAKHVSDSDRIEYAKAITSSSTRLSNLITNILRLNKLETHRLQAKKQSFDLGSQLGECILQYESIWEEKNIMLDIDIQDDVSVKSDSELLSLVWNNLLSNAFKFTENGGTVSVSLKADETYATVSITDSGCGISAETGKHIFNKFYQGDTSHSAQGNGLGLALVKRVIDIVGGEISVSSVVGEGSIFAVKLRRNADE